MKSSPVLRSFGVLYKAIRKTYCSYDFLEVLECLPKRFLDEINNDFVKLFSKEYYSPTVTTCIVDASEIQRIPMINSLISLTKEDTDWSLITLVIDAHVKISGDKRSEVIHSFVEALKANRDIRLKAFSQFFCICWIMRAQVMEIAAPYLKTCKKIEVDTIYWIASRLIDMDEVKRQPAFQRLLHDEKLADDKTTIKMLSDYLYQDFSP